MNKSERFFTRPWNVVLLAILCTLLWGSAFPGVKIGYELYQIGDGAPDKMVFAGYRFFAAGLLTILFGSLSQKKLLRPGRKNLADVAVLGLVQTTVQYIFFYVGLSNVTGVKGSILNSTGAFFAVILAHFFYRNDRLNGAKIAGCLIGLCGIFVCNLGGDMGGGFSLTGEGFMILASLSSAVGALLNKRAVQRGDSMMVTGYHLTFGGAVLLVTGLLGGGSVRNGGWQGFLVLAYLALLSAVAFTIWSLLLKYNPVGKICIFNFLIPIFGALLSAAFLGESIFEWKYLGALCLVCLGIALVNRPQKQPAAVP